MEPEGWTASLNRRRAFGSKQKAQGDGSFSGRSDAEKIWRKSGKVRTEKLSGYVEDIPRKSKQTTEPYTAEEITEKYDELIKKYGSIKPGEKAEREIKVPKKSSHNKYVSRFARTMADKFNRLYRNAEVIVGEPEVGGEKFSKKDIDYLLDDIIIDLEGN